MLRKPSISAAVGIFLLIAAVIFYYLAVLRIDFAKTGVFDLIPGPDAIEYFAQANAIVARGRPGIKIGADFLPSRYPPGYPAAMLPWLKLLPEAQKILAPVRTNQSIGVLLILAAFGTYLLVGKPITGGLAALLLATLPGFFTFCRAPMSEISACALVALAFALVYFGLSRKSRWQLYLAATALGLALNIRLQLISFAPLLIAMAVLDVKRSPGRWFLDCTAVLILFAAAASPIFVLNAVQFGSPLRTGYHFWLEGFSEKSPFSIHHIPQHANVLWSQIALRPSRYDSGNLFGTGTYFTPPFAALVGIGFLFLRPSRFVFVALLAGTSFFAATALFYLASARFYLPLFILLPAVAVLPLEWASRAMKEPKRVAFAGLLWMLGAAAVAGYPSQSGFPPKRGRWQVKDGMEMAKPPKRVHPSRAYAAVTQFSYSYASQPGTVLSDINPVYLNTLLPGGFVAAPIDGRHPYRYSSRWNYGKREATALVANSAAKNVPIYVLLTSEKQVATTLPRLPQLEGYIWTRPKTQTSTAVVLTLVRDI
ncbi:MAG: hypothetical protein ABR589_07395 [Chthoniobacterales bacterium]